jgi:hypothetical protein
MLGSLIFGKRGRIQEASHAIGERQPIDKSASFVWGNAVGISCRLLLEEVQAIVRQKFATAISRTKRELNQINSTCELKQVN